MGSPTEPSKILDKYTAKDLRCHDYILLKLSCSSFDFHPYKLQCSSIRYADKLASLLGLSLSELHNCCNTRSHRRTLKMIRAQGPKYPRQQRLVLLCSGEMECCIHYNGSLMPGSRFKALKSIRSNKSKTRNMFSNTCRPVSLNIVLIFPGTGNACAKN